MEHQQKFWFLQYLWVNSGDYEVSTVYKKMGGNILRLKAKASNSNVRFSLTFSYPTYWVSLKEDNDVEAWKYNFETYKITMKVSQSQAALKTIV